MNIISMEENSSEKRGGISYSEPASFGGPNKSLHGH